MLDAETYMFDRVKAALLEHFPDIEMSSSEVEQPSHLPYVTFSEYNNYSFRQMQTGDNVEHYVHVSFQVNAYSMKSAKQCSDIIDVVDDVMRGHGFLRRLNSPQPNMQRNIHRRVTRYSGIVAENGLVYKSNLSIEE